MADEDPDLLGNSRRTNFMGRIQGMVGAGFGVNVQEIQGAADSVGNLQANLAQLQRVLGGFSGTTGQGITRTLANITAQATAATNALAGVINTGYGGGTGSGGGTAGTPVSAAGGASFGGAGSWAQTATAQASSGRPGGMNTTSWFGGWKTAETAIAPLMFLRERLATNRQVSQTTAEALGMVSRQQGAPISTMMSTLSKFPGGIYGSPSDLLSLFGAAPALGASYSFGNRTSGQGVRAGGFLEGVRQAQLLNPGASVSELAGTIGGFSANTGAQQMSAYLTGGAYSMIASGGRQKSLTEWAEDILKWLMGLRGGAKRNKPFTYGELMAQYFPGSNIDAWFQANGVPQNLRQYWWTYALSKSSKAPDQTTAGGAMTITPDDTNLAYQRLRSTSELTRTEFGLGGAMTPAYLNKEQTNRWFNQLMGVLQQQMLPALAGGPLSFVQFLPDTIEDILMNAISGRARNSTGDIGDIGEGGYGTTGGTGLGQLSPNMRSKLGPMMAANPRLRINSGLRDTAMQKRLKARGFSRVSGKASAHTRGDAADLGPPSEYGWIIKNANRFGLKSGAGAGEPWHVGVGDSPFDSLAGGFDMDKIWELFKGMGGGADATISFLGPLMGALFGSLYNMTEGKAGPVYNPNQYNELVAKTKNLGAGLPTGFPSIDAPGFINPPGGGAGGGGTGGGTRHARGLVAADAAYKAGFRGADLVTAVAISGRESGGWNPNAYNGNRGTGDKSYGLMQINMIDSLGPARRKQFGISRNEDLFDPYTNMRAAYSMYETPGGMGNFYAWGPYKGKPATYNTNVDEARQIVRDAGLIGDVEAMTYAAMSGQTMRVSGGNTFQNTFVLSGNGNGSGAGGIDMRRTASIIANYLEEEMNKRAARSN